MRANSTRAWCPVLVGAIALLTAAARPAQAGCSHPSERPTLALASVGWIDPRPARQIDGAGPFRGTSAPKPCDGPQCSGKRAPAAATATPEMAPRVEWAWADGLRPATPGLDPPRWRAVAAPIAPLANPLPVFHPPRAA